MLNYLIKSEQKNKQNERLNSTDLDASLHTKGANKRLSCLSASPRLQLG